MLLLNQVNQFVQVLLHLSYRWAFRLLQTLVLLRVKPASFSWSVQSIILRMKNLISTRDWSSSILQPVRGGFFTPSLGRLAREGLGFLWLKSNERRELNFQETFRFWRLNLSFVPKFFWVSYPFLRPYSRVYGFSENSPRLPKECQRQLGHSDQTVYLPRFCSTRHKRRQTP